MNNYTLGPGLVATTGECQCSRFYADVADHTPGEQHRRQRKMLNPAFNINHMRDMTPIFYEVAHRVGVNTLLRSPVLIS